MPAHKQYSTASKQIWNPPSAFRQQKSTGFVLVSVLLLVALATLLVVVGSMLAQIERLAAANSAKTEQARTNALFALDVALDQLQREAGPDQRVTARAEILDADPATATIEGVNQPHWTAVWRTGANHLDVGPTPQRRSSLGATNPTAQQKLDNAEWIVSNPDPAVPVSPLTYTGTTSGTARDAVDIARNYGNSTVTVPLVPIQSLKGNQTLTTGAYGYWASDEGVKAKVNQTSPTMVASGFAENKLHFSAPQAIPQNTGLLGGNNTVDLRAPSNSTALAKVKTLPALQNLPGIAPGSLEGTESAKLSADATVHGLGVLADVRLGGLKKDLTAAFEDAGNSATANYGKLNPGGTAQVYKAITDGIGTTQSSYAVDGLKWLTLYSHYNLYKNALPSVNMYGRALNPTGSVPLGIGNPNGVRPFEVGIRAIGWQDPSFPQGAETTYGMLAPSFLGYRWDTSISSTRNGTGSDGRPLYTLQLNYYFQVILHNPYSVAIVSPLRNFRLGRQLAAAPNIYLETQISDGGTTNWYYTAVNQAATARRMIFTTSSDDTARLEPGETRVFGLSSSVSGLKVTEACEFRGDVAPYGFESRGYSPTFSRTANLQRITGGTNPSDDTYDWVPAIPAGATVRLRLTRRPDAAAFSNPTTNTNPATEYTVEGSGSADVSITEAAWWWTAG